MDSGDSQEEMVSATGDKRSRALSASSVGGPRKNPRLEVAKFVSLMFIFICFLGGGHFRGPVGVLAAGVPQCVAAYPWAVA